jgi:hypothetical protein
MWQLCGWGRVAICITFHKRGFDFFLYHCTSIRQFSKLRDYCKAPVWIQTATVEETPRSDQEWAHSRIKTMTNFIKLLLVLHGQRN